MLLHYFKLHSKTLKLTPQHPLQLPLDITPFLLLLTDLVHSYSYLRILSLPCYDFSPYGRPHVEHASSMPFIRVYLPCFLLAAAELLLHVHFIFTT